MSNRYINTLNIKLSNISYLYKSSFKTISKSFNIRLLPNDYQTPDTNINHTAISIHTVILFIYLAIFHFETNGNNNYN